MLKHEDQMSVHLQGAVGKLKKGLLALAALAEEQLTQAIVALTQRDSRLAKAVIQRDSEIDQLEVDLEEECLEVLALHQPVAHDLRFVVTVLKINNDLERIGDYAVNVAERAVALSELPERIDPIQYGELGKRVSQMLRESIEALINQDVNLARKVWRSDLEIDKTHSGNFGLVEEKIRAQPADAHYLIQLLSVSRNLERVADLATNIAEDVVYLVEGKIIRHQPRV